MPWGKLHIICSPLHDHTDSPCRCSLSLTFIIVADPGAPMKACQSHRPVMSDEGPELTSSRDPWFLAAAAPGSSSYSSSPLGWTRYLWTSRCVPGSRPCCLRYIGGEQQNRGLRPKPQPTLRPDGRVDLRACSRRPEPQGRPPQPLASLSISDLEKPQLVGHRAGPKPRKTPRAKWQAPSRFDVSCGSHTFKIHAIH